MDFKEWIEKMQSEAAEQVATVEEIGRRANAEKLFVSTLLMMVVGPASEMSEATHGTVPVQAEILAYHLYPLFGKSNEDISPVEVDICSAASEKVLAANSLLIEAGTEADPAASLVRQIERQARIVRGSAYQEQTANEIIEVQGQFDGWFTAKIGISPTRAQEALWKIYEHGNIFIQSNIEAVFAKAYNYEKEWRRVRKIKTDRRSTEEHQFASAFPRMEHAMHYGWVREMSELGFADYPGHLQNLGFTDAEVKGLEQLIGMTFANRADILDVVEVKQRPLYFLTDGRVVLADIANAMDALWDALEAVAKSDQAFYDSKYQVHKGKWLESKSIQYLKRIFPANSIYNGLSYPDPGKGAGATTELDIAVAWGPFLILGEAKAKQFRIEGQLGDAARLRTDIKRNVQDAFEQAKRAADYIEATDSPEFTEIKTGRKLQIDKSQLNKTFIMTVSLHQLAGLATTLAVFNDLGLFGGSEYPFSISIADLDFVTEFTQHPDVFLHYIEKRLEVQKLNVSILVDELDFLGAYLDTRFARPYFWEKYGTDFNAISIGGFSAVFDDLMMFRRGLTADEPKIALDVPPEIAEILAQLRATGDDYSRKVGFDLLGLPSEVLRAIGQLLREIRSSQLNWGNIRRQALVVADVVVVGTAEIGVRPVDFIRRSKEIANIEKYIRRATRMFTLAVAPQNKAAIFEYVDYTEEPWAYDAKIERLIAAEPPKASVTPSRLPKPNEKCVCGSNRKFKKCCSGKLSLRR